MAAHPFSDFVDPDTDAHTSFLANFFSRFPGSHRGDPPQIREVLRVRVRHPAQRRDGGVDAFRVPISAAAEDHRGGP